MTSTTDFNEITVFGARGTSLMILRLLEEHWQGRVRIVALIDDIDNGFDHDQLGVPVISSEARQRDFSDVPVLNTISKPELRARIHDQLIADGATLATATCRDQIHVDPSIQYSAGCLVSPNTRIGPNVTIGDGAMVLSTIVAHDVEIGRFCNLGIHSSVLGHVVLEDRVNIAPNATVGNGHPDKPIRIGADAILGVGTVATRSVPAEANMVGNPAMSVQHWRKLHRLLSST